MADNNFYPRQFFSATPSFLQHTDVAPPALLQDSEHEYCLQSITSLSSPSRPVQVLGTASIFSRQVVEDRASTPSKQPTEDASLSQAAMNKLVSLHSASRSLSEQPKLLLPTVGGCFSFDDQSIELRSNSRKLSEQDASSPTLSSYRRDTIDTLHSSHVESNSLPSLVSADSQTCPVELPRMRHKQKKHRKRATKKRMQHLKTRSVPPQSSSFNHPAIPAESPCPMERTDSELYGGPKPYFVKRSVTTCGNIMVADVACLMDTEDEMDCSSLAIDPALNDSISTSRSRRSPVTTPTVICENTLRGRKKHKRKSRKKRQDVVGKGVSQFSSPFELASKSVQTALDYCEANRDQCSDDENVMYSYV